MLVPLSLMTAVALAAAVSDLRTRRIPNLLTGGLALCALAIHAFGGPLELALTLAAMLVVFVAGTAAFSAGWFGGGDVKLVAACAGMVGFPHLLPLLCCIGIAGGFVGVVYALKLGRLRAVVASSAGALGGHAPVERIHLPYGVAIAAGSFAYTLYSFTVSH